MFDHVTIQEHLSLGYLIFTLSNNSINSVYESIEDNQNKR